MTGPLILSSDSPTNSQAADANYVQAQIQPLTAKVNNAVQQNGNATLSSTTLGTLSLGHLTNSVGLQSFTVPGCTFTAGTVGNNCVVQGQLAVQEPDTNWIGVCQIENAPANGNGNVVLIGLISTKTVSSFYISEVAGNTQATGGGDIGCTVTHH